MNVNKDYFYYAEKDLEAMEILINANVSYENVTVLAQQSSEKYLKGLYQIEFNEVLKTHNLYAIIAKLLTKYPKLKDVMKDASFIQGFYFTSRYPSEEDFDITLEIRDEVVNSCYIVIGVVKEALRQSKIKKSNFFDNLNN